jgi:hypothetical protein
MTDFDPDAPLTDKASYDAYVNWCADQFVEAMHGVDRIEAVPHGRTYRAATLLLVRAVAPLGLDDECDTDREQHLKNLARLSEVARDTERNKPHVGLRDWIVARGVVDCFRATGRFAGNNLDAAKCALASIILTEAHPLYDLGEVHAPDAWALVLYGYDRLVEITEQAGEDVLGPWDFTVMPDQAIIDRMHWQKVNNAAAQMGAPPFSPN